MSTKKACVIYINAMTQVAEDVKGLLEAQGYMVCLTEALIEEVKAAQQSSELVTPAVEACLLDASLKIFLIPTGAIPSSMLQAADQASKSPGRLIAICEKDSQLPKVFDDLANSVVPVGSPDLLNAIVNQDIWQKTDGATVPPRKIVRVKCQ